MKRIFQMIGLFSLLVFSFFLTNKTATVIKNLDDIMIQIKENKDKYEKKAIDAIIKDKGIIPGISKIVVNVDKSYNKMREYGKYNANLYVYDFIKPKISIDGNLDKYIIRGNSKKRMISLNFIIKTKDDLDNVLRILKKYDIKGNFFIDEKWLSDNLNLTYFLINEGNIIGINECKDYEWMSTILTKVGKQKSNYCYYLSDKSLKKCKKINGYTIKGIYIDHNYYGEILNNLKSGSIITFKVSEELLKNLDNILNFIIKKGYTIENLENHIKE